MQTTPPYRTNRGPFSERYLDVRLPETEAWAAVDDDALRRVYAEVRDLWERERGTDAERAGPRREAAVVRPLFELLGLSVAGRGPAGDGERPPDYALFESDEAARGASERREREGGVSENGVSADAVAVADARRWGRPLDARGSDDHPRDCEHPGYRMHRALRGTAVEWGVLTNGRRWRLYRASTGHRLDGYHEVDLAALVEADDLAAFKRFYLLFRREAFRDDAGGDCFLDGARADSAALVRESSDRLRDGLREAVAVLADGFLRHPDNDLDADEADRDDLDLLRDSALVYLYRLVFVRYAESDSRDLLDPGDEAYRESFSLRAVERELAERDGASPTDPDGDTLWSRFDALFALVDRGSESVDAPELDRSIPAYGGELFRTDPEADDRRETVFLAEHRVDDAHLRRVVELLTRGGPSGEADPAPVDYASLDVRHLGSVYERLLDVRLDVAEEPLARDGGEYVSAGADGDVAVPEGAVYVTDDGGRRKATGSYYTPDRVVDHIVERTLEPLVDEVRRAATDGADGADAVGPAFAEEFARGVFDLCVLDPAVGSGRFLTGVVDYLTRAVVAARERQAAIHGVETVTNGGPDRIRRRVAARCLYGVDADPLAAALAKMSLWLRLAPDRPVPALDRRLAVGNSLLGDDVDGSPGWGSERVGAGVAAGDRPAPTGDAVGRSGRRRLRAAANVRTAGRFALDDCPDDAFARATAALADGEWDRVERTAWFRDAQRVAADERFFHYRLAYPEVFDALGGDSDDHSDGGHSGAGADDSGATADHYDADAPGGDATAGFDAVLGNPPYVSAWNRDLRHDDYFRARYDSAAGHYDLYCLFLERGLSLARDGGRVSMIVPDAFCGQAYAENCRRLLAEEATVEAVLDLRGRRVFDAPQVDTVVVTARNSPDGGGEVVVETAQSGDGESSDGQSAGGGTFGRSHAFPHGLLSADNGYRIPLSEDGLHRGIREKVAWGVELGAAFYVSKGMEPHTADGRSKYEFVEREEPTPGAKPYVEGKHIARWRIRSNWHVDYSPDEHKAPAFPELFESRKIVGVRTVGEGRPAFAVDERGFYDNEKVLNAVPYDELADVAEAYPRIGVDDERVANAAAFSAYAVATVLNSTLTEFSFREIQSGALDFFPRHLKAVRLPEPEAVPAYEERPRDEIEARGPNANSAACYSSLHDAGRRLSDLHAERAALDADLSNHLGSWREERSLSDFDGVGPVSGVESTVLSATTERFEGLRIGDVSASVADGSVTVSATARYKPDADERAADVDAWGYTETEPIEAVEYTGSDGTVRDMLRFLVPTVTDPSTPLASFRERARTSITPLDRLRDLRLPVPAAVEDGLDDYRARHEAVAELTARIDDLEATADSLVFDLYGLTPEERAIVTEATGGE